ncbi:MAG: alkene reductase [Proteobacteria bacterium]|nr:alkene reductase [Pseudomonadota bacterium]
MTPSLFSPLRVGAIEVANRVVMAPLTRNRAPDAIPTALMAEYYAQRADPARGAGLIVSEATAISPMGQGYAHVPGLYGTEQLDGWKRVTRAVHAKGGKMVCQLWHVGRVSHRSLLPDNAEPVAPSAVLANAKTYIFDAQGHGHFAPTSAPRALHRHEIPGVVHDYAAAARNAVKSAGFDGVEIHGANGYLLDQFLKTGANQRGDDYGGSIENRARLMLEATRAVVDAVGHDRVGIRLSPVTPANDIDDADPQPLFDYLIRQLAPLGLAYVHVIEGATGGPRALPERPFDYAALKSAYRTAGGRGAWMVNNGYDPVLAQDAIASGRADLVAFGKAFICMPDLTERMRRGGPYQGLDKLTMYGGGAKGYTDYPALGDRGR